MKAAFKVVFLGCTGGPKEDNLSSYLLAPIDKEEWITLDAGSLLSGIEKAFEKKSLKEESLNSEEYLPSVSFLRNSVKAYLISHAHLDHIAALVLNSQMDSNKHLLGTDVTVDHLKDHIFNGKIWPNYGSEGINPISRYEYVRLPIDEEIRIPNTSMYVKTYLLNHPKNYLSSAFLIHASDSYVLYFGDTSSDSMEEENHMETIWKKAAPLFSAGKLHGIFLECSYAEEEHVQIRYGHLNTDLMIQELTAFSKITSRPLTDLNVIVSHRKGSYKKACDNFEKIQKELQMKNRLGVNFIFPTQGASIEI